MKVKKYIVNDLAEAMTKIKDDFGDDAYILETKKIKKGGFIGFGGKKFLEVTVLSEKEEEKAKNHVSNGAKEKADTFENDLYDMKSVISNNRRLEKRIRQERKELGSSFCRGCGYCLPCPAKIPISMAARMKFLLRRSPYKNFLTPQWQENMLKIRNCTNCGSCKSKCPYNLDTPIILKDMLDDYIEFARNKGIIINRREK